MPDTRLVTAQELERFPDDDFRHELVVGRVIRTSPVGYLHGKVVAHGVREVLIVDPDDSSVAVHRASRGAVTLHSRDELNLDDVGAGFRCAVDEILE